MKRYLRCKEDISYSRLSGEGLFSVVAAPSCTLLAFFSEYKVPVDWLEKVWWRLHTVFSQEMLD